MSLLKRIFRHVDTLPTFEPRPMTEDEIAIKRKYDARAYGVDISNWTGLDIQESKDIWLFNGSGEWVLLPVISLCSTHLYIASPFDGQGRWRLTLIWRKIRPPYFIQQMMARAAKMGPIEGSAIIIEVPDTTPE